jgi:predicted CXXCH cytochrome family protein
VNSDCSIDKVVAATLVMLIILARTACADITLSPGQSCASASCHDDLLQNPGVHEVGVDGQFCDDCHVTDEPDKHEFRYAESGGQLCTGCHSELTQGDHKHVPAEMGLCTFCHSAHESEYEGHLKFPPEALCVSCHDKIVPDGARTVHGPVEEGRCVACHDPHSSDTDDHLISPVPELCFNCHDQDQTDHEGRTLPAVEETFVDSSLNQHPPFARGDCLLCHDPHASDNIRLQRRPYEQAFYTDFSSDSYFCLMCHGEATFTEPRTLTATKFRNGNLNLHYRHVNREKGRGCRSCHHQHASRFEAQIASDTYFGEQNIGIKAFSKTETGASCEPSCHRPVQYDRISPVDNAFPVTPREGEDATAAELRQASTEQDGETMFLQRCAGCHGADADGKIGPPIRGATIEKVIAATNRVDLMADLALLDPADLHAIVASLPAGTPVVALPAGASDGTVLFSTNCAGCHGADASGNIGPTIRGAGSTAITEAIDRVPMMVAMKSLGEESIDTIGDYLRSLADIDVAPEGAVAAGAQEGKVVYSMNCVGCHGADANGQIGPAIRSMSEANITDAIGRVPMMLGLQSLDSADIVAVSRYLSGFETAEPATTAVQVTDGGAVFSSSCSACHGEDAGGHIGPDIRGHTTEDIVAAIDRVPMMAGVKAITEQQLNAVGEYIGQLTGPGPPEDALSSLDGEAIFKMNCAACHGPDAKGLVGPDITLASTEDVTAAIEQVPMMVAMKVLGARDIEATVGYLTNIRGSERAGPNE